MAGSGKGVLRIAIEDFFQTTIVGKFLQDKIVKIGETIEAVEAAYYGGFAKAIQNTKGIPDDIKAVLPFAPGHGHQGGIFSAMGFAGQLGGQAASALFAPYGKLLNYQIDQTAKSMRLDAGSAIAGNWRDPTFQKLFEDDLNDLGWNADRVKVVTKLMRPRLDPNALIVLVHREKLTPIQFIAEMSAKGWLPDDAALFMELGNVIPGIQDLMAMANRLVWDENIAARFGTDANFESEVNAWANKQGLSSEWVKKYWRMHWAIPGLSQGMEMLHRLRPGRTQNTFTREDMLMLFKISDFPVFWWERFMEVSYNPFTRVDVRRMHKLGVITDDELLQTYMDLGYDLEHAKKLTDWTIKNETLTDTTKVETARTMNQGTIIDAYQKKVIDRTQAAKLLTDLKYDPQEIEIILKAAEFQKVVAAKTDIVKAFNDKMRSEIVSAYEAQMLSKELASAMLSSLGYAADEVVFVLKFADFDYQNTILNSTLGLIGKAYTTGTMTQSEVVAMLGKYNISGLQQTQLFSEWETQRTIKTKRLTEAQYTSAWKKALITDAEFRLILADLGYTGSDIELYIKISTPVASSV